VLCNSCNVALGLCGDDPERLRGMISYLSKYQPNDREPGEATPISGWLFPL
jgi:hypothetical protein